MIIIIVLVDLNTQSLRAIVLTDYGRHQTAIHSNILTRQLSYSITSSKSSQSRTSHHDPHQHIINITHSDQHQLTNPQTGLTSDRPHVQAGDQPHICQVLT